MPADKAKKRLRVRVLLCRDVTCVQVVAARIAAATAKKMMKTRKKGETAKSIMGEGGVLVVTGRVELIVLVRFSMDAM